MSFHESQDEKDSETLHHHFYKTVTWLNYSFGLVWRASTFGYKYVILYLNIFLYTEKHYQLFRFGSVQYLLTVFIKNENTNARRVEVNF